MCFGPVQDRFLLNSEGNLLIVMNVLNQTGSCPTTFIFYNDTNPCRKVSFLSKIFGQTIPKGQTAVINMAKTRVSEIPLL